MTPDVLLENEEVCELFVADRALVHHSEWRLGPVDAHVGLQVPFCREGSSTNFTFKGAFTSMNTVMHLKGALTGENTVTDDALVGVGQLVLDVVHQLLQFTGLRFVNFHELFEVVVIIENVSRKYGGSERVGIMD